MKKLNPDIKTRDEIIFGEYKPDDYKMGGIKRFDGLSIDDLQRLLAFNFADPNERQNYAPSIAKIAEFMKKYPCFTAHGYAVADWRGDYRVSIEGVECTMTHSVEEADAFAEMFHEADEFEVSPERIFCWYD